MYVISQLYIINVAVMLLVSFADVYVPYYCLIHLDEGLIVLSRKRSICFGFDKNVESSKVAAYCCNMVLQIHLLA